LKTVRSNYQSTANKLNEYSAYPGDWIYSSWSNSDLKAWADERGIPVPQPTKRDQLIATVRRNSRSASQALSSWSSAVASSAAAATQSISDAVFDTWSDSQLKKWADERGVKVPQGSKRNEVIALVRKHNYKLNEEAAKYSSSMASAYGAATSSANNQYAKATDDASLKLEGLKQSVWEYIEWAKAQVGIAGDKAEEAKKQATKSYSSASKSAITAASSASKKASKGYDEL
jgi:Putative nuclear envelope organisation protein